MRAEILCIGTELLLGNILNTDAKYLAEGLAQCGISCYRQTVLGDNCDRVATEITAALSRADILIITGGLGPTADDITKDAVAKALDLPLVMDEASKEHILSYFAKAGREVSENNLKQAYFPKGAKIFENNWGTANAFTVEWEDKIIYVLPGPPRELQPIFDKYVAPTLLKNAGQALVKHQVRSFGIWESAVEDKLIHLTRDLVNPSVGIYAGCGEVMLQVTARAETEAAAEAMTAPVVEEIKEKLGSAVYGIDVPNIESRVLSLLREKKMVLATAESCTGGLVSKRMTELAGSSEVFGFGFVTYANEAKEKLLGVRHETLEAFGAVSEQTAREMAQGALGVSGADVALSITGIAGPGGGTAEKPVGTVYVAVATKERTNVSKLELYRPGADRAYIRNYAASFALNEVRKTLENK